MLDTINGSAKVEYNTIVVVLDINTTNEQAQTIVDVLKGLYRVVAVFPGRALPTPLALVETTSSSRET